MVAYFHQVAQEQVRMIQLKDDSLEKVKSEMTEQVSRIKKKAKKAISEKEQSIKQVNMLVTQIDSLQKLTNVMELSMIENI